MTLKVQRLSESIHATAALIAGAMAELRVVIKLAWKTSRHRLH